MRATLHATVLNGSVTVNWTQKGRHFRQKLKLPQRYFPADRSWYDGHPGLLYWGSRADKMSLVVVCVDRSGGSWGYMSPFVFQLRGDSWHNITPNPDICSFSDAGSFHCKGDKMVVWDIDYVEQERTGHRDPQRYKLRIYERGKQRLSLVKQIVTKKRYEQFGLPFVTATQKMPSPDPLRELGYHWRWWG